MKPCRITIFAAATVIMWTVATAATAAESPVRQRALVEAQKFIDGCWAETLKDRSARALALNRRGHARTVVCLKRLALDEMGRIFEKGKGLSRKQANQKTEALLDAAKELYWPIYNNNVYCRRTCGLATHAAHMSEQARILEILIRTVIQLRHANDRVIFGPNYWK